jgi:hypothetical protein
MRRLLGSIKGQGQLICGGDLSALVRYSIDVWQPDPKYPDFRRADGRIEGDDDLLFNIISGRAGLPTLLLETGESLRIGLTRHVTNSGEAEIIVSAPLPEFLRAAFAPSK